MFKFDVLSRMSTSTGKYQGRRGQGPIDRMDHQARVPLWIDCDPGHDDAFAILLALYHPALRLLGLSTTYGNAPLRRTTENTLSILDAVGCPDVVVVPGAAGPFCRQAVTAADIHGESGIDGTDLLPKPTRSPSNQNAIVEIYRALMACPPGTAWLITTGPLTNAALLFATFPDVVDHIKGLSIMGGAIGSGFTNANLGPPFKDAGGEMQARIGNCTPYAEFNIWVDPEASQSVFQNPKLSRKTTLIPLDVSHQVFATAEVQQLILLGDEKGSSETGVRPTRMRKMFYELLTFYARTYADTFGLVEGPPLHDPLTVAVVLATSVDKATKIDFKGGGERFDVTVELSGPELGRTKAKSAQEGVKIPRGLDNERFWLTVDRCLAKADKHVGRTPAPL